MKLNKKGMTTIEIITSFSLAFIIFIILFNVIISLKNIYTDSGIKTNVLIEQANFNRQLNAVVNKNNIIKTIKLNRDNYSDDYSEYIIEFSDDQQSTLKVDKANKRITLNDYVYNLPQTTEIVDNSDKYIVWSKIGDYIYNYYDESNGLIVIEIPIQDKFLKEKFNLKALYQYSSNTLVQIEL